MGLIIGGKYQHYKGKYYRVLGIAKHTETFEELIIYQALYDENIIWARPKNMFCDNVLVNGIKKERFHYIPEEKKDME